MRPTMRVCLAAAYLLAVLLVIYAPAVGQGFVSDDFAWISSTRPSIGPSTVNAFSHSWGFYRPLVTVSFAVNHEISGLSPRPYGFTNLLLLVACAGLVVWLAQLAGL